MMDDDFPYKNLDPAMVSAIRARYIALKSYRATFVRRSYRIHNAPEFDLRSLRFGPYRAPCVMLLCAADYERYNLISDWFIERHRIRAYRGDDPAKESVYDYWGANRERIRAICDARSDGDDLVARNHCAREIVYENKMEVGTFRPTVAVGIIQMMRAILCEHCEYILNPCAGWGDRLIGVTAAGGVQGMVDVDPNPDLGAEYERMMTWIREIDPAQTFDRKYFAQPFEDVTDDVLRGAVAQLSGARDGVGFRQDYDLALIAPPYFDLEVYVPGNASQSIERYNTFEKWYSEFLIPLVLKCGRLLRRGGVVALIINQAPAAREDEGARFLQRMLRDISRKLRYIGVISYAEERGKYLRSPQPIWIWQRE